MGVRIRRSRKIREVERDDRVTATDAPTASIDVLSTLAVRGVLLEIAEEFHKLTGLSFAATYKSTNAVLASIAQGATADMTIITHEAIDRLVRNGIVLAEGTADLAQSGIGIAVRTGAPKPDISTVAALKRTLLETKSVAFSRAGASGVHFAHVIEQLGIADEVRRKAHIGDAYMGEVTARGEAELAVQQISELMPVAGIEIVGPLPDEVQKISVFAAGIFRAARNPDGARKLISYLAEPGLAPVLMRKGLEPVGSAHASVHRSDVS